jgi:protein arginine kinase activator
MTFKDFKKLGRLGCGECYGAFRSFLGPLLKRIHGSNLHCGKAPVSRIGKVLRRRVEARDARQVSGAGREAVSAPPAPKDPVAALRIRLQKAVEAEAYEEAARLRDQIKELEKSSHGEGKKE